MALNEKVKAATRRKQRSNMGPHASLRNLRMSARKVRLVVDMVRGKNVQTVIDELSFCPKAAAGPVAKLLRSAAANAYEARKRGKKYDLNKLYVAEAYVNEGSTWRRYLTRAMGRSTRVRKRTSHVHVVLAESIL